MKKNKKLMCSVLHGSWSIRAFSQKGRRFPTLKNSTKNVSFAIDQSESSITPEKCSLFRARALSTFNRILIQKSKINFALNWLEDGLQKKNN